MYVRIFGVGEFKYAIRIFQGANVVAMAAKCRQKINQNCTDFCSVQGMEAIFACVVGLLGSANSNMLSEFFNKGCCYVNQI